MDLSLALLCESVESAFTREPNSACIVMTIEITAITITDLSHGGKKFKQTANRVAVIMLQGGFKNPELP